MAGGIKARWFPSLSHKRSPPSTSPAPPSPSPPKEYLCPISGHLMADPIILPNGQTFERNCIIACIDLGVDLPLLPPFPLSASTPLIPNLALRSSIHSWCSSTSTPLPTPLDPPNALSIVRSYSNANPSPLSSFSTFLDGSPDHEASPTPPPVVTGDASHATHSSYSSSSSASTTTTATVSGEAIQEESTEIHDDPIPNSPLEAQILAKLKSSEQEEGLLLLRRETRDSKEQRAMLCTVTLLTALRPFLLSRDNSLQSHAAACIVNLSLEPHNKTPILRSGVVPPLISALKSVDPDTRSNAAAALFSLSVDNENKAAVGALGALPPLLLIVSRSNESPQTVRDALLALYHLSLNCATNHGKLAKLECAGTLLRIVKRGNVDALTHVALMVMSNLANCNEGRAALMDAGVVEAVVGVLRSLNLDEGGSQRKVGGTVEQCVAVLYGLSRGSLRFRGVAKAAGAEDTLKMVAAEEEEGEGDRVREMARKVLRAVKGKGIGGLEELRSHGIAEGSMSGSAVIPSSVASFPRWGGGGRQGQLGGGVNSTEF